MFDVIRESVRDIEHSRDVLTLSDSKPEPYAHRLLEPTVTAIESTDETARSTANG